jgi:hypothetical protein
MVAELVMKDFLSDISNDNSDGKHPLLKLIQLPMRNFWSIINTLTNNRKTSSFIVIRDSYQVIIDTEIT